MPADVAVRSGGFQPPRSYGGGWKPPLRGEAFQAAFANHTLESYDNSITSRFQETVNPDRVRCPVEKSPLNLNSDCTEPP